MTKLIIGVLALQGAIEAHEQALHRAASKMNLEIEVRRVILQEEIDAVDGLVMPGGESTAMILIGKKNGMLDAVKQKLLNDLPAFGTCAGAILLSKEVRRTKDSDIKQGAFPILNVEIIRNGYGRQRESFSTTLQVKDQDFHSIFIRAPVFSKIREGVEVITSINDDPVFVRQGNIFATTFHPELSEDTRIHEMFLETVLKKKSVPR